MSNISPPDTSINHRMKSCFISQRCLTFPTAWSASMQICWKISMEVYNQKAKFIQLGSIVRSGHQSCIRWKYCGNNFQFESKLHTKKWHLIIPNNFFSRNKKMNNIRTILHTMPPQRRRRRWLSGKTWKKTVIIIIGTLRNNTRFLSLWSTHKTTTLATLPYLVEQCNNFRRRRRT